MIIEQFIFLVRDFIRFLEGNRLHVIIFKEEYLLKLDSFIILFKITI